MPAPQFPEGDRSEVRQLKSLFAKESRTLRDNYAAGKLLRLLADDPDVAVRGGGWRKRVAEAVGVSESTLNKCLQVRDEYKEGGLAEMERMGVGWYRLTIALAVPDRKRRRQLLRQAAKQGWDEHTLQRAIQQLKGARRGGGRPPKEEKGLGLQPDLDAPDRPDEAVVRLLRGGLGRRASRTTHAELESGLAGPARATLDELLDDAAEKLGAMRKGCGDALAQVRSLQSTLRQEAAG